MIPQAPLIPPPSFEPVPQAPLVLPEVDREAEVAIPPIEPPMPDEFEIVPGPAMVTAPSEPVDEPAPLISALGAQPPPVEGADVELARGHDRIRMLGEERTAAEREGANAAGELRAAAAAFQSATTPAEQAQAMAAAERAKQRMQGAQAMAQATGLAQEREQAAQQAEAESALAAERTARYSEAAQVLDDRAAETERRVAEAQGVRQRAQERRAQREQEYAALLDRGPQDTAATWTAAIGMIGEMWSAYAQRRQPNLGVWLERGLQQAKEAHAGDLDAIRARIGAEEQAIEDVAVDVAQRQADDLAFEQAYLARLDRDLAIVAAQYAQQPKGAAAEQARRAVQAQQQARAAEAMAAAEKAERERAKSAAELRKSGLEADLLERKLRGTGTGATAKAGARTNISESALVDPVTGVVLGESRFQDRGKVREDQDTIRAMSDTLTEMQEYVNLLANAGRIYQGAGAKFVKGADRARLEAKHSKLLADIIRAYSGAAATDAEVERLKKVLPPPKSYTDMGSWDPAQVVRDYRDTHARIYENFLGSRLTTGFTTIRGPNGETLPTSPTAGWRAERGDAPVRTVVGDIVVDLNQPGEREWRTALTQRVLEAASAEEGDRQKIIEGIEKAADAMDATKQPARAKRVREALKEIEEATEAMQAVRGGAVSRAVDLPSSLLTDVEAVGDLLGGE